jgi:hypothetical protein
VKSMPSTVRLALLAAAGFHVLAIPTMAGSKPSLAPRTTFVELDAALDKNDIGSIQESSAEALGLTDFSGLSLT